jgi:uncharacterized protein YdhG (YjbR/CyaY superfamily)
VDDAQTDVERYLTALPAEVQASLEQLRRVIGAAAPGSVEQMSYGVPTFKHSGRSLVSFGAAKKHCSFYVMSPAVMEAHRDELEGYDTSKGTVRFQADRPLPTELVTRLVEARLRENAEAAAGTGG